MKVAVCIALAMLVCVATAASDASLYIDQEKALLNHEHPDHQALFSEFKKVYDRSYADEEEHATRLGYFKDNLKRIKFLNDNDEGATYAITNFADMSDEELDRHQMVHVDDGLLKDSAASLPHVHDKEGAYTASRWVSDEAEDASVDDYDSDADVDDIVKLIEAELKNEADSDEEEINVNDQRVRTTPANKGARPEGYDWREHGVVTHVKNQRSCGSCWAFSIIGNVEGMTKLYGDNPHATPLSEQNLVDCVHGSGCGGGDVVKAMGYLKDYPYVLTEKDYPYKSLEGSCRFKVHGSKGLQDSDRDIGANLLNTAYKADVKEIVRIGPNEDSIADFLYHHGPLAGAIHGRGWLHFYHSGVANPSNCPKNITHGVVLVGYGVENGKKYWIYKNSWGPVFGESGFFRMERGVNACGLANLVVSALPSKAAAMGYNVVG